MTWQEVLLSDFRSRIEGAPAYPCPFAVSGLRNGQIRFVFQESQEDVSVLAHHLARFLREARGLGKYPALVVFFQPGTVDTLDRYHAALWRILRGLTALDPAPWPSGIPTETDDPRWEFCFTGESVFVMASTPAHSLRKSRYAPSLTLTFQPGWVFDDALVTDEAAARAAEEVRKRLIAYDAAPPHPLLDDADGSVHHKFFLHDDNRVMQCPYSSLRR